MLVFNCSGKKNSSLVSQIKAKIFPTQKFLILPKENCEDTISEAKIMVVIMLIPI